MDKQQKLYIGIGILGLLTLVAVFHRKQQIRRKKDEELAIIDQHIAQGTGGIGNKSVTNSLHGVQPDLNYSYAHENAKTIYDANSNWGALFDSDEDVIDVLQNKTKAQIAAIQEAFEQIYNRDFEDYLDFLSDDNWDLVMDIIKKAP
ncbi:hypothetical protein BKI52_02650 [marine bacterium AO1-C]|nr:hypothetical protein BKI52_02650 [marine bacterium AO1-C]